MEKKKNNEGKAWSGNQFDIFPSVIFLPSLLPGYSLICETVQTRLVHNEQQQEQHN